jgi:hypothetical protein
MPPALRRLKGLAKTLGRAEYQRRWRAAGGPRYAAAVRAQNLAKTKPRVTAPAAQDTLRRRAKALLRKDRDEFLTRARHALRRHRLRCRAELLLHPDAVMHRDVERASARRRLMADLRAAGWWYRLTGERTNDIL